MGENEPTDARLLGKLGNRRLTAMARQCCQVGLVVAKIALVNEHVHASNLLKVRGVGRGARVRDERERPSRPVDAIAERASWMGLRPVTQPAAVRQLPRAIEWLPRDRWHRGKQIGMEQMLADARQLVGRSVDGRLGRTAFQHVVKECQPHRMIKVRVCQVDVERRRAEPLADAKKTGAGVEGDSQLGQKQATRMTPV